MAKKIKIKDIAAKLGLSSTLVSLVLNNKADQHGIRKDTQERVIALAQQMGFYENDKVDPIKDIFDIGPGIIGMVVSSLKDPFIAEISDHLRKAFASIGYGFSLITWDAKDNRFRRMVSNMRRMYSGVILAGDTADDNIIRALKASDYPFVVLEISNVNLRLNIVQSDCEAGAAKLASHIKKFNYKNLKILQSNQNIPYSNEKVDCVKRGLFEKLPEINLEIIKLDIDITNSLDLDTLKPLFRKPNAAELLIVSESTLVYPLVDALNSLKLRIPQDIAIISLEDGPGFGLLSPPITRLKRDIASMSSKTVSILWTEIKNQGKSKFKRTVNLAPDLIIGDSCGAI